VHHQIVLAQPAVAGEEILHRLLAHLGRDLERIVGAGLLDRVQIGGHRGIDAGLPHRRHPVHLGEIALRPFAGLVVHVPVERRGQQQALRGRQADRMDVGDQRQQRGHLLAAGEDTELGGGLDLVGVVRRPAGDADDLGLGGLRLQDEGRQVRRRERRPHCAEHLAAVPGHDGGGILLQRMAERVVVGDEEPAVAAPLHDFLRGADRERTGVEHPLHRIGRAELAVEVGRAGRVRDEQLLLLVGDVLHRKPDRRHRHVDDEVDLIDVVPAPRDGRADIGLELVIADDHRNRLAEHGAAEIVHRHLCGGDRALSGRRRSRAVHVGQYADLDDVVGYLRRYGRGSQQRGCERPEHG